MANERLLALALNLNRREVIVPEWEDEVCWIREFTALEMERFIATTYKPSIVKGKKGGDTSEVMPVTAMINILSYCLVGEDGKQLFTKRQLQAISAPIILRLGMIAFEINDLDTGEDEKKPVGDAVEDLKNEESDISITNSHKSSGK